MPPLPATATSRSVKLPPGARKNGMRASGTAARIAAFVFVVVLLKVLLDLRDERLRDVEDGGNFVLADAVSLIALEKATDLVEARLRPEVAVPDLSEQLLMP